MATILKDAAYMALPMNIKRGNPIPLDTTAVWYDKTELETYAKSGATAYVGQVLTLIADGKAEAYMISNEAGTLVKLAQTTASGDLAHDVSDLQTKVDGLTDKVGAAAEGETPASGLFALIEEVKTLAESKVASVTAGDASITIGGEDTAPTVAVKVSEAEGNALSLVDDGLKVVIPEVKVPAYSLVKDGTAADGDIATYHLTKDGVNEGVAINIPKDLVVASGSVVELEGGHIPEDAPEGTEAGTYIKLILANSDKPIYINVGSLIEYVTGGSGENDAIQINVSSDTHKVTASVKAGSLTKNMLASGVQESLGKADSAIQEITAGSANGTISVDGEDVAVKGLADAAYATVASLNETAQGYADAAKTELLGKSTDTAESNTIAGAKKYADSVAETASSGASTALDNKIQDLKNTDEAVANQFVTAVKEANGIVTVERKALVAADIPELAQSKISGLDTALAGKQDNLTFDGAYEAGVNNVATVNTVNNAKTALVGDTSADATTTDGNTIADVRRYVDAKTKNIASDKALEALTTRVGTAESEIDALQEAIGANGSVTKAIAEAKKAGTDAAAAVSALESGKVKDNADAIAAINNADTGILKQAKDYADGKDTAIAEAKKAGTDAAAAVSALADGQVKTNKEDIVTINGKLGTIPADKTIADMISDAQTAATYDDTALKNRVSAIESDYLKAADKTELEGKITTEKERIDAFLNAADVGDAAVDTLKEIQDYISTHGEAADEMVKNIAANKTAIEEEAKTARAAEEANTNAIGVLNGDAATTGSVANTVNSAISDLNLDSTYVKQEANKRLMTSAEGTKLAGIAEGAQVNVIESIKVNGTAQTVTGKAVDIAVPVADGTSIALTDNKLSVKSVNVNLLAQTKGDELIIDGGHA